jgi:hypothetical protein
VIDLVDGNPYMHLDVRLSNAGVEHHDIRLSGGFSPDSKWRSNFTIDGESTAYQAGYDNEKGFQS